MRCSDGAAGVSDNQEHQLVGRLRLYRSVPEVLNAARINRLR
ncbi:MAG TPA: hypothetical protein VKA46_13015 [Gemmataceae bacterium]|nr:hypothetical protein [Gemmataceae bacterium]